MRAYASFRKVTSHEHGSIQSKAGVPPNLAALQQMDITDIKICPSNKKVPDLLVILHSKWISECWTMLVREEVFVDDVAQA